MSKKYDVFIAEGLEIKSLASQNLELAIERFKKWSDQIKLETKSLDSSIYSTICSLMIFQENPFSKANNLSSLFSIIDRVTNLLGTIPSLECHELNEQYALIVIRKILRNFYKHLETMYQSPVHGNGTIKKVDLDKITIGNEYDVQRMLYSVIKPIFPNARTEVYSDAGYRGTRFDILINEYDVTVEVKCTRPSMTEKDLVEQLGSDAYHYDKKHILFFIYDKEKLISNVDAFESNYSKALNDKLLETYIIQPRSL